MSRATALVSRFEHRGAVSASAEEAVRGASVVVNTTPVGLHDDALPVPLESLEYGAVVMDIVYRRGETAFVRGARARGHKTQDGLSMLVEQGALAFERWFSVRPDREAMWEAVREAR